MYLMYVDESGDCGMHRSPTRYFVLSGLIVHELDWRNILEALVAFRKSMKQSFSLKLREEIHAAAFITKPGDLQRIPKHERMAILRNYASMLARLQHCADVINVVVDKQGKAADYDVFEMAWTALIQRFENTKKYGDFSRKSAIDDCLMVVPDQTDNKKLELLLRKMRRYNPIPNQQNMGEGYRNLPIEYVIEDPFFKNSEHSYFIQSVDLIAFWLYQWLAPNQYIKKSGAQNNLKKWSLFYANGLQAKIRMASSVFKQRQKGRGTFPPPWWDPTSAVEPPFRSTFIIGRKATGVKYNGDILLIMRMNHEPDQSNQA